MQIQEFIIRLSIAVLCGAVIGFERQWQNKRAGLRTNTLVAIGAAIYVLMSVSLTIESGDVTRIIGQVVTGVGFLGAGIILHQGTNIQGLTTAATIWCSSAIGCLAGAGFMIEAAISTVVILLVNLLFLRVDNFIFRRKNREIE